MWQLLNMKLGFVYPVSQCRKPPSSAAGRHSYLQALTPQFTKDVSAECKKC